MKSYDELAAHIAAVEKVGKWIALSKFFGDMTEAQGCIISADCFITGIPLLEYQRRNQLVSGRPNIPYDAMLAAFQERGGSIKILQRNPDGCKIELTYKGQTTQFSLMWEDAQKEAFVYGVKGKSESDIVNMLAAGQKPTLKPKYATPRSRSVMLFARCVSDAIRVVAPEVNFGRYTPEEIEDMDDSPAKPSATSTMAPPVQSTATAPIATTADSTVATTPAPTTAPTLPLEPADVPAAVFLEAPQKATVEQREAVLKLLEMEVQRGFDHRPKLKTKLQHHKIADGILGLTLAEADDLIAKLKARDFDSWYTSAILGYEAARDGSHRPS